MNSAAQALRDNPSWSKMPKEWLRVALWSYGYSEEVPDRQAIAKALVAAGPAAAGR
jgi:hypothetical protein